MFEKNIEDLTKEELLDSNFLQSIFEYYQDENERNEIIGDLVVVARKNKVATQFNASLKKLKRALDGNGEDKAEDIDAELLLCLSLTKKGEPEITIDNYVQAILNIKEIRNAILYNEFTQKFERILSDGSIKQWDDFDDAWLVHKIEQECHIYDTKKCFYALYRLKDTFKYHPIKDKIESIVWDKQPRIDDFLVNIMKCECESEDTQLYLRETSRMIFYGGIERLYHEGCKFDYMPVLIGEQGTCKSTIINWLTMDTNSYQEVISIDGKDSADILRTTWVGEFAELLAMVRSKEVEGMKAFLSRNIDTFRPAYARHTISVPRHCIFIGTTNVYEFLKDATGNRRYLPVYVNTSRGELYERESEVKHYIEQCWAEAKFLMDNHKTYLSVSPDVYDTLELERSYAVEENPKLNDILNYLSTLEVGYKVCGKELYVNALNGVSKDFDRRRSQEISILMQGVKGWRRSKNPMVLNDWGTQRYWTKVEQVDNMNILKEHVNFELEDRDDNEK